MARDKFAFLGTDEYFEPHKGTAIVHHGRIVTRAGTHFDAYDKHEQSLGKDKKNIKSFDKENRDAFVTNRGRVVSTREALRIAKKKGQIKNADFQEDYEDQGAGKRLSSESLYDAKDTIPGQDNIGRRLR